VRSREVAIFSALAHPERLAIVEELRRGPACVCHLTAALGRPQAYISQQLGVLRDAGLVEGRRRGVYTYYHVRDLGVLAAIDVVRVAPRAAGPAPGRVGVRSCACPQCRAEAAEARPDAR